MLATQEGGGRRRNSVRSIISNIIEFIVNLILSTATCNSQTPLPIILAQKPSTKTKARYPQPDFTLPWQKSLSWVFKKDTRIGKGENVQAKVVKAKTIPN